MSEEQKRAPLSPAAGQMFPRPGSEGMTATSVSVKSFIQWHVRELRVGRGKQERAILRDIRSGKTSLLECISLRNRNFKGSVLVDGAPPLDLLTTTAMVYQKELFFGFMTPREHLTFHATARMSSFANSDAIKERVHQVTRETNLESCQDTIIGGNDPLFMAKGLSGGERKRLNLAAELLRCPAIIFLDEPTSGLDSVMAESVVRTLSHLSTTGARIVMASLHCPSSDVMAHVTHLLVLSFDGRIAYHGLRQDAVAHFSNIGYSYPKDYNPADYVLQIVSRSQYQPLHEEQSRMDRVVDLFDRSECNQARSLPAIDMRHVVSGVLPMQSSSWVLFRLNLARAMLYQRRMFMVLVAGGLVSVAIGLLFGVLFFQQATSSWRNILGLNFSVVVSTLIFSSTAMVLEVPLGQAILQREYISGVNSPGPYLLGYFAAGWPYYMAPLLEATIIYWMTGMQASVSAYFLYCLILVLTSLAALSLGVCVGSMSSQIVLCLILLPAIETPMIMFSGLLYERRTIPAWLSWIEQVSIVNHGFSAITIETSGFLPPTAKLLLLSFLEINAAEFLVHLGALGLINLVCQAGAYVILKTRFATAGMRGAAVM